MGRRMIIVHDHDQQDVEAERNLLWSDFEGSAILCPPNIFSCSLSLTAKLLSAV